MKKISIAIVDDYVIFRDGLKVGLTSDDNFEVVLEAGNGEELLQKLEEISPDVILMDLKLPVMDGIEATRIVRSRFNGIKILVVTMYDDEKFVIHMMENGANGYLLKDTDAAEIRKAIYAVHENGYYFNDVVSKALLKRLVLKGNLKPSFNHGIEFSERELQVLKLICEEKTAPEIGKELFLSHRSVENIRQRLIEKVGVRNTAGLVMFAARNGLI